MRILLSLLTFFFLLVPQALAMGTTMQFNKANVSWKSVLGAKTYNIYYKETGENKYTHAVRNLPSSSIGYTINSLKKNIGYWYTLTAVGADGKEFWKSAPKKLPTVPTK